MLRSGEDSTTKGTLMDFFNPKKQVVYDLTSDGEDDLEELASNVDPDNNTSSSRTNDGFPTTSSAEAVPSTAHKNTRPPTGSSILLLDDDEETTTKKRSALIIPTPRHKRRARNTDRSSDSLLSFFAKPTTPPSPAQPSQSAQTFQIPTVRHEQRPAHDFDPPEETESLMHLFGRNTPPEPTRVLPRTFMNASALLTTQGKSYTTTTRPLQPSNRPKTVEYRPQLSDEQQRVLDLAVKDNQSVFFTGSAGTGKSVLMRAMIDALKGKYGTGVAVTASTGIAACNISGCTLHSFAGIGMGHEPVEKLIENISWRKTSRERWQKTKVLIIDEISMVDATLFDKLETIARRFCVPEKPFGGIQLIVTGDFFQLPPVKSTGFSFEAKSWATVMKKTVVLTHVFRQKEQLFVDVLNEMRVGKLSETALRLFASLNRPLPESEIDPAELYPLRRQVEQSNNTRLDALQGAIVEFKANDSGRDPKKMESCIAPSLTRLKKNAQVMLLKNMDPSLVNGSLGIVAGFAGDETYHSTTMLRGRLAPNRRGEPPTEADMQEMIDRRYPVVRFANDREILIENDRWSLTLPDGTELASRSQIPLILAWAMSIHKSQGQTLERVRVDLGHSFEDGMAYVALSRATSMDALQIVNFKPSKVTASAKVATFYRSLEVV